MSSICKKEYQVDLVTDFVALVNFFWVKKVITIPGMSWAGGALSDWQLETDVPDETLNINVLNWHAIDRVMPECCPKNLNAFKTWLLFWLRNMAKKQIAEKAKGHFLNNSAYGPPKPPSFQPSAPGSYNAGSEPIDPARVTVPIKFTVTTQYNCDESCKCTIECNKHEDILLDFSNTPITPNSTNPNGGGMLVRPEQFALSQEKDSFKQVI